MKNLNDQVRYGGCDESDAVAMERKKIEIVKQKLEEAQRTELEVTTGQKEVPRLGKHKRETDIPFTLPWRPTLSSNPSQ